MTEGCRKRKCRGANMGPASPPSRCPRARRAMARGTARAGGAEGRNQGLSASSSTAAVSRTVRAGCVHCRVSEGRSRGIDRPGIQVRCRKNCPGVNRRQDCGSPRSDRIRVAPSPRKARSARPAMARAAGAAAGSRHTSAVPRDARRHCTLGTRRRSWYRTNFSDFP